MRFYRIIELIYKEECSMEYFNGNCLKNNTISLSNKLRKQIKNYKSSDNNLNAT